MINILTMKIKQIRYPMHNCKYPHKYKYPFQFQIQIEVRVHFTVYDMPLIDYYYFRFVWTPVCIAAHCDKLSLDEIVPHMHTGIARTAQEDLHDLLGSMKVLLKHNFYSSLIVIAGALMSVHYRTIISMYGGFPIVLAEGPTETGKSTAMKAALSLVGMAKTGFYVEGTNGYFMERSAMSSLPYGIDEACNGSKQLDLVKLIVDLHGGGKTANLKRGSFLPKSVPIIGSNDMLKNDARLVCGSANKFWHFLWV